MALKKHSMQRFSPDDAVRVKAGVTDPDYPDIPIGGWAGQIVEGETGNPPTYLVRWNQQTLDHIDPIYRNRCERDGLDIEEMWLAEEGLTMEPSASKIFQHQPSRHRCRTGQS